MPTASLTATGVIGPAATISAQSFVDVVNFAIDIPGNVIRVEQTRGRVTHLDYSATTTTTVTIASTGVTKATTLVVSQ